MKSAKFKKKRSKHYDHYISTLFKGISPHILQFKVVLLLNFNAYSSSCTSVETVGIRQLYVLSKDLTENDACIRGINFECSNWSEPVFFRKIWVEFGKETRLVCRQDIQICLPNKSENYCLDEH